MKFFLLLTLLLSFLHPCAQHYQVAVDNIYRIRMTNLAGIISIQGSSKAEITIDYHPEISNVKTPSATNVSLSNGLGLSLQKDGSDFVIAGTLPAGTRGRYVVTVPEKLQLICQSETGFTQRVSVTKFKGDIDIRIAKEVSLENVSGGITIQTTDGKVYVKTLGIRKHKPISIITESGTIRFSMPAKSNAELKLGSVTGTVYFFRKARGGTTRVEAKQFNTTLGSGGTEIHIQSLSGNIHLEQF